MSYYIRVFCKSTAPVTASQIGKFIVEGAFFEEEHFEPSLGSPAADDEKWQTLSLTYEKGRRPIVIEHTTEESDLLAQELREIKEEVLPTIDKPEAIERIAAHLDATKATYSFDIDPSSLSDDAWEVLDLLETYIAQRQDGIVYADSDGFFDSKLQRIGGVKS